MANQLGNNKKEIRNKIRSIITPDDVIAVMFSFFESEEFPLDTRKIHSSLHSLKDQFPELLEEFIFSENDVYPYSRLLEKVLFRLQSASLINTVNPDFKICRVPRASKQFIKENILPLFKADQQKKLEELGKLFEKKIFANT